MPYVKRAKKTNKPRKAYRKKRTVRRGGSQMARLHETITLEDLKPNIAYDAFINLGLFKRATDVADNYQEYRISRVVWKFTPLYDTFVDASGNAGLPYLYNKRHTYEAPTTFDLDYLKALGAKPRRFDDKTLSVSYVPNVNMAVFGDNSATTGGTQLVNTSGKPAYKPWLNTHLTTAPATEVMDTTRHYGLAFWIDQFQAAAGSSTVGQLECTAYFEFQKPWDLATITVDTPAKTIVMAKK